MILEYLYYDVFTSQNSLPAGVGGVNIDINKSVALSDNVIGCYQIASAIGTYQLDSFATSYVDNSSWWYQLGSNQYPLQIKIIIRPARIMTLLLPIIDLAEPISALTGSGFLHYYAVYGPSMASLWPLPPRPLHGPSIKNTCSARGGTRT